MRLHPEPFEQICSGGKTVEVRLNDGKRQGIAVGDTLVFSKRPDFNEKLEAVVKSRTEFKTFAELFTRLPAVEKHDMTQYYSAADEARWGVVALEFVVVK